jgi:hypothetical protein
MIEAVIERCAGIDVGKKFGTIVSELDRLAAWLVSEGCTHAVMESTGSYWKPVFNLHGFRASSRIHPAMQRRLDQTGSIATYLHQSATLNGGDLPNSWRRP